jgi:hypothetical protein
LRDSRESYVKHGLTALSYSGLLVFYAVIIFIHAVVPFIFVNTGSDGIRSLIERIEKRKSSAEQQILSEFPH